MSYPLIILGAGASYDLLQEEDFPVTRKVQLKQWKPPITNQIFDGVRFQEILKKYPEMSGIVSIIRGKLRNQQESTFETILTELYEKGTVNDPELYKEFAALLYYISDLFRTITHNYHEDVTNYAALKHLIRQYGAKAVFVNFNYDLLLEMALNKDIENVDSYIVGEQPVIKIHGACNWYWRRRINLNEEKPSYTLSVVPEISKLLFTDNPDKHKWQLQTVKIDTNPKNIMAKHYISSLEGHMYHPALALPIFEKNNYVCPASHIDLLTKKLSEIDRIIIIGWKIGDKFLRDLLKEELKNRPIPIAFIGGENSNEVVTETEAIIKKNVSLIDNKGFSHFIGSDKCESFFD